MVSSAETPEESARGEARASQDYYRHSALYSVRDTSEYKLNYKENYMRITIQDKTPKISTLEFIKFDDGFETSLVVRGWV